MPLVVPDNQEYAILKSFAREQQTPGVPGLEVPGIDPVKLAGGHGCAARHLTSVDEVTAAVQGALGGEGPTVLVAPITPEIPPLL